MGESNVIANKLKCGGSEVQRHDWVGLIALSTLFCNAFLETLEKALEDFCLSDIFLFLCNTASIQSSLSFNEKRLFILYWTFHQVVFTPHFIRQYFRRFSYPWMVLQWDTFRSFILSGWSDGNCCCFVIVCNAFHWVVIFSLTYYAQILLRWIKDII